MFRTRRLLWLPVAMLFIGAGIYYLLVLDQVGEEMIGFAVLYIQLFFLPTGLLTYFIGGYVAPRASYLIGFLLGVLNGFLLMPFVYTGLEFVAPVEPGGEPVPPADPAADPMNTLFGVMSMSILFGTLAGAFAGWYRDFLRRLSARSRARREADMQQKRREQKRAAKRGNR